MCSRISSGIPSSRLLLLCAVLEKSLNLPLGGFDIYLNVAGGLKVLEPGVDLGVCLAIVSSWKNKPLREKVAVFGEVGLLGEVRPVGFWEKRVKEAKKLGDILIVAINSDESVRRIKGHGRPILDQDARAEMLAALNSVDYVIIYKEDTANRLIQIIRPDVYVKGSDYENRDVLEAKTVRENGGEVEFIQIKKDKKGNKISSSNLVKINE